MKFIKLTVITEDEKQIIHEPALIALDVIEQIRLTKEGTLIYYKDTRDSKDGAALADRVKENAQDIVNTILEADVQIIRMTKKDEQIKTT